MEGQGIVQRDFDALEVSLSGLPGLFRSTFSWNDLSKLQQKELDRNLSLLNTSVTTLAETKHDLYLLMGYLERFWAAANYARINNDRAIVMGLDAEDLLTLYRENLAKTRKAVDGWQT